MKRPAKYFRAGVGAVITDGNGRILALERSDFRGAWQLPQGGLKRGETTLEGVTREIAEETGLKARALKLLDRYPELLVYELPPEAQSKKTGLGQVQQWFYFTLKKAPTRKIEPPKGEFRGAKWVPFSRVVSGAPEFRKPVYKKLRAHYEKAVAEGRGRAARAR
jgi:putative (di)nucleoside polyphosphate hydrolase